MPKEETIELRHIRSVIGEKEDLPSFNPRTSIITKLKAVLLKIVGLPELIHRFGVSNVDKTITLNSRIRSIHSDGRKLYVGLTSDPGKLHKIDIDNFIIEQTITFPINVRHLGAITSDGTNLYVSSQDFRTGAWIVTLWKINIESFVIVSELNIPTISNEVSSLLNDGTNIYALSTDSTLMKIPISTFVVDSSIVLTASSIKMVLDGRFIYSVTGTGKIDKIDIDTFTLISTISPGNQFVNIYSDGNYLYVTDTTFNDRKLYKIDILTFTLVDSLVLTYLPANVVSDGTCLYISSSSPTTITTVVDILTFTIVKTIPIGADCITTDGFNLYIDTFPTVTRKYLIPTISLDSKKIDVIKDSNYSVISASTSLGLTTTLIDTARTEGNDYWNGLTLFILGGSCKGQSRKITDFDAATDTITVSPAFNGIITSDVRYAILPTGSSSLLVTDILSDSTPFAGGDVAIIKTDVATLKQQSVTNVSMMEFNSNIDETIILTTTTSNVNIRDVTVAGLPANITIIKVWGFIKIRAFDNTSAVTNAINGDAVIKIKKSTGTWGVDDVNLIDIQNDIWETAASTKEGGMILNSKTTYNTSSEVDDNATYNLRFDGNIFVDADSLRLIDVTTGLKIYFIPT